MLSEPVANPFLAAFPNHLSLHSENTLKNHPSPYPSVPLNLNNPLTSFPGFGSSASGYQSLISSRLAATGFNFMLANSQLSQANSASFQNLLATLSSLYENGSSNLNSSSSNNISSVRSSVSDTLINAKLTSTTNSNGSPLCLVTKEYGNKNSDFRTSSIASLRAKAREHEISMKRDSTENNT
jgi:OAR domain